MAISSVDTLPVPAQTPPLTPTTTQKKPAYVQQDLSENGQSRAELTEYQAESAVKGDDGEELSFWDVLDVINPLQHIPIVNSVYRELTGDKITSGAKLAGGALFFGPIGLGFAALDVGVKEMTGAAIDEHVVAMIKGEDAGENARVAAAAEESQKAAKVAKAAKAEGTAAPATDVRTSGGTVEATPIGTAEAATAPLGLFTSVAAPPATQTAQAAQTTAPANAPLGLMAAASTQAVASQSAQDAVANTRSLESTRPRARLARTPQVSQDHLAMAMQTQGLEPSKLMTVSSRSATAVSAQMIAAEKQAQAQGQSTPPAPVQTASAPAAARTGAPTQLMPAAAPTAPPAAENAAAQPGTPVDVPAWFDSAMMKASAAYQKTNKVTSAP